MQARIRALLVLAKAAVLVPTCASLALGQPDLDFSAPDRATPDLPAAEQFETPADNIRLDLVRWLNASSMADSEDVPGRKFKRTLSGSGKFSLNVPAYTWRQRSQTHRLHSGFGLLLEEPKTGMWLRGRIGPRTSSGIGGVLAHENAYAKMLIDFRPENAEAEVSLETYRGSAIFCGSLKWRKLRPACSLVFVALHGRETVRFHGLVQSKDPAEIGAMLEEMASLLSTLQLHEVPIVRNSRR